MQGSYKLKAANDIFIDGKLLMFRPLNIMPNETNNMHSINDMFSYNFTLKTTIRG